MALYLREKSVSDTSKKLKRRLIVQPFPRYRNQPNYMLSRLPILAKKCGHLCFTKDKVFVYIFLIVGRVTSNSAVFTREYDTLFRHRIFYATTPLRHETPGRLPIQFLTPFFYSPTPTHSRSLFSLTLYKYLNAGYSPAERAFESSELSRPQANHRSPILI